ncbi:MAG: hypothetical protein EOM24_29275, partial [Chloroflexia bacterium]|nr:hypothetical protein [Chloroflexia bacterium]
MLQLDVSDIQTEIDWIEQRLNAQHQQFADLIRTSPCLALSMLETIAADRARKLHLTLLARGLGVDYDAWATTSMDQRMCDIGFRPVSRYQPLYLRRTALGIEISDLFATVQITPADV